MRSWKTKKKDGGVFLFSIMLALLVVIGMPMKVQAEESENTSADYYIWKNKVSLNEDGTGVVSTGPITVTQNGNVSTISMNANVLGSIWFCEGGEYILEANEHVVYPKDQTCAIDGNFMKNLNIDLTLKGDGKYFGGGDHVIYLTGDGSTLCIESGSFYNGDISADEKIEVVRKGQNNVYIITPNNVSGDYNYTVDEALPTYPWYGIDYNLLVKQEEPSDIDKNYITTPPNPLDYTYAQTPTPDAVQPDGGSNNQPGTNPSNPNGSGEGSIMPPIAGDSSVEEYTGTREEIVPVVIEIPAGQKYVKNVLEQLSAVPTDGKVVIDTEDWYCFNRTLAEKIADRKDVAVTITYKYQGKKYEVTIPAGSDIVSLLDENGFVGFRYLDAVFGGREITE